MEDGERTYHSQLQERYVLACPVTEPRSRGMYQARSQTREEVPTRPDPPGLPGPNDRAGCSPDVGRASRRGYRHGNPLPPLILAFHVLGYVRHHRGGGPPQPMTAASGRRWRGQAIAPPVRCSCGAVGCRSERFWAVAQRSSFALSSGIRPCAGTASRCGTSPSRCRRSHGSRCRRWSSARTRCGARRRPRPRSRRPPCPLPPPCRRAPARPRAR